MSYLYNATLAAQSASAFDKVGAGTAAAPLVPTIEVGIGMRILKTKTFLDTVGVKQVGQI